MFFRHAPKGPRIQMLDKPSVSLPKAGFLPSFAVWTTLLILGWAGAFSCFYTAFRIEINLYPVLLMAAFCAPLCAAQFLSSKGIWIGLPMGGIWFLAMGNLFDRVTQGGLRTVNVVLNAYREKLDIPFPVLQGQWVTAEESHALMTLFCMMLVYPFLFLLAFLLIRSHTALGAFTLTGLFFLVPLAISVIPKGWALGLILLFWLYLLMASPSLTHRFRLTEERRSYQLTGESFFRPVTLALLPILFLTMVLVHRFFPLSDYERPDTVNAMRASLTEEGDLLSRIRLGISNQREEVNLGTLGDLNYTGETALGVRRTWTDRRLDTGNEPEYLRGFVGSVYDNNRWKVLPASTRKELDKLIPEGFAQNLPYNLSTNMPTADNPYFYTLTVENIDADNKSIYAPYALNSRDPLEDSLQYSSDWGYYDPLWMFSDSTHSFSALHLPASEEYRSYLGRLISWRDNVLSGYFNNPYDENILKLAESEQESLFGFYSRANEITGMREADLVQYADTDYAVNWTKESVKLARALEDYNAFVYETYTQVPENMKYFLENFAAEHNLVLGRSRSAQDSLSQRQSFIRAVQELFEREYSYTYTPPKVPRDNEFTRYFLAVSKTGYCVHFATAATLLFRSAGIPARYVQGYVAYLPENNRRYAVPDYCAHAWVEVYYGGTGWVPVEVTPAAYIAVSPSGVPESQNPVLFPQEHEGVDYIAPEEFTENPDTRPTPSPTPQPTPEPEDEEQGGSRGGSRRLLDPRWLLIPAVPLLLVFSLWGNRKLQLLHRENRFSGWDRNKAALYIWRQILRVERWGEKHPFSDLPDHTPARELAEKARFSNHKLTAGEIDTLRKFYYEHTRCLDMVLTPRERLWARYVLVLY